VSTNTPLSGNYKAMVYFAVAILHFYRDELLPRTPGQTLGDFADANRPVIDQVLREAVQSFGYELSHEQIGRAVQAYLSPSCVLTPRPERPVHQDQQEGPMATNTAGGVIVTERLREIALDQAVRLVADRATSGQDVVGIAEGFLAFLTGDKPKEG
jgi:hypothetical protein